MHHICHCMLSNKQSINKSVTCQIIFHINTIILYKFDYKTNHYIISDYSFLSTMGCTCKRVLFITGLFLMELVDLVLDWYFFAQINKTEQEPIRSENALQYSILSFSIVGTFTFILQLLALYVDGKKDYSQMTYSTAMSVISTLFEDLPQIMLAAWVAAVSSEVISNIQYAKAIYAIVEALIHIGISIWQLCCTKETLKNKENSNCLKTFLYFDLVGGGLIICVSFYITYTLLLVVHIL